MQITLQIDAALKWLALANQALAAFAQFRRCQEVDRKGIRTREQHCMGSYEISMLAPSIGSSLIIKLESGLKSNML